MFVKMNVTIVSQLIYTMDWSGRFSQGELLEAVVVSNLQPVTNYTFRAVAVNQLGPGSPSMEFLFMTGIIIYNDLYYD